MAWKFNNNIPIYIQIIDEIKLRIAKGALRPGDRVPPVRDLALKAGVNPNTMQKALSELEREGVLYSNRTAGRFVAEPATTSSDMRDVVIEQYLCDFVSNMRNLGYADCEIKNKLELYLNKEENR